MRVLISLGLILISTSAYGSTICKVEKSFVAPDVITWNMETGTAKVVAMSGETLVGTVTAKRTRDSQFLVGDGYTINIFIKFAKPHLGSDAYEFIVFYVGPNEQDYRIAGVSYIIRDGRRLLSGMLGNFKATCVSS